MCVYFWKRCEDFDVLDHVTVNEESDPDKISSFLNGQIDRAYPVGKPLWDIVLLPNYVLTTSAIVARMHHSVGDGLSFIAFVRDMCDENPASVSTVIHAGLAGAVRRIILDRGGTPTGDIAATYVLPKLNHPGTLSNNAFCISLTTPMSGDDGIKRVTRISQQLNRIFSFAPIASTLHFNILGLLLGAHMDTKVLSNLFTFVHSNMVFIGEPLKLFGSTLDRMVATAGLIRKSNPLFVLTTSYNGKLNLQLVGDKAVFPDQESLFRVARYVEDEFEKLDGQSDAEMASQNLIATLV